MTVFIAVPLGLACMILFLRWRSRRSERCQAILARIDDERERCVSLWNSAMAGPPIIFPSWAKRLTVSVKTDALRVLTRLDRTLTLAKTFAVKDAGVAEILLEEASATLDAAARMVALADVTIPEIVDEERRFARDMLEKVRQMRKEFEAYVRRQMEEGLPFEDEARRIAMLENALCADESVIEGDARGALALMQKQAAYLGSIGRTVHVHVAVHDHIAKLGRTLPLRLEEAQATRVAAERMLVELKAKRPDKDWGPLEELLQSMPALFESVLGRIRTATILCASRERKFSQALAEAAAAESAMDTIDGRLLSVMETWSEGLAGRPSE